MPGGSWRFELCDYAGGGSEQIEQAYTRKVTFGLNMTPTVAFTVALTNPLAPDLLGLNVLVKAYRNNVLSFVGPVVTAEEATEGAGGNGTLAVTAAGVFWRLGKRLVGKGVDANGKGVGYAEGTSLAMVDRGTIAMHLIENANATAETGVATNAAWIQASATAFVGPWYFKSVAEAVTEMSATLDGYDFEITPIEPAGGKIGEFRVYAAKGAAKPEVVFEYGDGKLNMKGYRRPKTLDGLLNVGYSLPAGFPDAAAAGSVPVSNTVDVAASIAAYGRAEGVVQGELTVDDFRQKLVDEHVRIRRYPREQIIFEVDDGAEYDYGADYAVGDTVTGRAKVGGSVRFDGSVRIYGAQFEIDDAGVERVALTMVPQA